MTIIKMFFGIGCAVALAACTDNGVLFRSFGSYDKKDIGGVLYLYLRGLKTSGLMLEPEVSSGVFFTKPSFICFLHDKYR